MNPDKEQLIAYFSGALAPDQKRLVEDWLSNSPDNQLVEECIRVALEDGSAVEMEEAVPEKTVKAYARFREMTKAYQSKAKRFPLFRYGMAAAAVLIFLAIGMKWYRYILPAQEQRSVAARPRVKAYYAARAAITRITLGDGSIVRLFPGSVLTLSDSFNTSDRTVQLKGRGFFEVARNTMLPFYVRSGRVSTRVLGTSFDVNTNQNNDTRVVVREGKVQVADASNVLSDLGPGAGITVDKVSGRWKVQPVNTDEYCSWTKGELGFRQHPLREILPTLELWFNVSFQVQRRDILNKKLTFFIRRQNLQEAMEVLSATGKFRYQLRSDTVIIK